jgi:hypothetical protein
MTTTAPECNASMSATPAGHFKYFAIKCSNSSNHKEHVQHFAIGYLVMQIWSQTSRPARVETIIPAPILFPHYIMQPPT